MKFTKSVEVILVAVVSVFSLNSGVRADFNLPGPISGLPWVHEGLRLN